MSQHAKLSPSASHTWMKCSGALPLKFSQGIVGGGSSIYAEIGTAIHEVVEQYYKHDGKKPLSDWMDEVVNDILIDTEHLQIARGFIDYVDKNVPTTNRSYELRVHVKSVEEYYDHHIGEEAATLVEQALSQGHDPDEARPSYLTQCFGTADIVAFDEDTSTLHVADLKTGAGVKVDVERNSQLMIYALGAFYTVSFRSKIKRFAIHIGQPPLDNYGCYEFELEELMEFEEDLFTALDNMITKAHVYTIGEKQCRFCDAKLVCPAMAEAAQDAARADFAEIKDDSELMAKWLGLAPVVTQFFKDIEEKALKDLQAGNKIPGFRLGQTRPKRVFKSKPEEIEETARANGIPPSVLYKKTMLTAPQSADVFNLFGVDASELDEHIGWTEPSPKVVPKDSSSPDYNKNDSARRDFS